MVLWLCAHLPLLPLDALRPGSLNALPMLVWHGQGEEQRSQRTVWVVNAAAQALGLHPGMRLSTAQALVPQVLIRTRDTALEARFLHEFALAMGALTPHLVIQAPDVLMEVGSCLRLFGGVRRLQVLARALATDCGAQVHWGLASTPLAARLFARTPGHVAPTPRPTRAGGTTRFKLPDPAGDEAALDIPTAGRQRPWPRCVQPSSTRRHLQTIPLAQLAQVAGLDSASLTMLHSLGVQRLAGLQALPRAGLARRGAQAWLDALDRARGERPDPQVPFEAPERFETGLELQQRTDNAEVLASAAALLLQPLAGWLSLRWQAAQRLRLVLQHERRLHAHRHEAPGDDDPATDTLQLDLALPSRDAAQLATLLRERLNRHPLRAPVYGLRLLLDLSVAHAGHPSALIPDARERQHDLGVLVERLRARLGAERVLQLVPVDDARPECADQPRPVDPATLTRPGRPLRAPSRTGARRSRTPLDVARMPAAVSAPAPDPNPNPVLAAAEASAETTVTRRAGALGAPEAVAPEAATAPRRQALDTPPRPAWLLREPLALDEDDGVPLQEPAPAGPGQHNAPRPSRRERRLLLIGKAERIETGWFDGHLVRRDYHVALGRDGVLRWVYLERGTPDTDRPRWFLHGLFA